MTKRRIAQIAREKASLERHRELMQDPEYAAKWNELTSQLFGFLAELPEEALEDDRTTTDQ